MRFAVIGTNFVTDWLIQAGKSCNDFELTTVYSRTYERAKEYAEKYGAPFATASLDELAGSAKVDAVYIASPTSLHFWQAIQMLRAKKHVLCEKPIASNTHELLEMLNTARENNVSVMEAIRPGFLPTLNKLQELSREIGSIRRAVLSFCKYSSRYDRFRAGENINAFNPALSNGALMDLGVYCIHVMLRLFDTPKNLQSTCVKLHNGVDVVGSVLASYDDKIVELSYSKVSDSHQYCEIQGEEGSLYFKDIVILRDMEIAYRNENQRSRIHVPMLEDDMYYELSEFIKLTEFPAEMEAHQRYSLEAMKILDEVRNQCGIVFPSDNKI